MKLLTVTLFLATSAFVAAQTTQGPTKVKGTLEVTGATTLDAPVSGTSATFSGTLAAGASVTTPTLTLTGNTGYAYANGSSPLSYSSTIPYSQLTGIPATGVSSVFGRTGAVTATSGDYAVGQVTGAAPLASPTFTGIVTAPNINGVYSVAQFPGTDVGAKINACLAALPSGKGTCDTRGLGTGVFPMAQITIGNGQKLQCDFGQEFQPTTAAETMVIQNNNSIITGCWFDASNQAAFSGKVISYTDNYRDGSQTTLEHSKLTAYPVRTGTAIYMSATSASTQSIYTLTLNDVTIEGFYYGRYLTATTTGFINSVNFNGVQDSYSVIGTELIPTSTGSIVRNSFVADNFQAGPATDVGIQIDGAGVWQQNYWTNLSIWDTTNGIVINNTTTNAGNFFFGSFDGYAVTDPTGTNTFCNQFNGVCKWGSSVTIEASNILSFNSLDGAVVYAAAVPSFASLSKAFFGFNASTGNGEADWYTGLNQGPTAIAHQWWAPNTGGTAWQSLMTLLNNGTLGVKTYANANGTVIPATALGYQGPAAGYVQLAPSSIGTPGCLYDNGSGIRSWAACSVGSYLPLSGGTLTGALNGTSASFSGTLSSPAMVPTNITPSTSPVCANGTGGALTTTGCTGGTGTMTWPTFTGLTKYGGASNWVTPTFADVTALWTTCTTGWLKFDGTCSTPSGGGSSGPPNAVTSCGMDNTGTTPIDTALLACIAALPSSGGEIYFPPGVYLATSPVVTSAKNVKLIGAGVSSQQGTQGAVVFQSACAGGGDVLEFSPSAVNQQGPELDNIEFVDISGTGACRSGLHMLQTNNVVLNGVSFLNFLGKTLTETVSFASGGGTITGTGFTAAMTPAIVQVGGMNYEANYTNVTTLTLVGTYYGTATSPASAVIHWNGAGLLIDGGPNFSQFWTINRFNAQNVLYPYRTVGSKSAAMGTSANRINGGFVNCNRLPDSIGVWLGEFTDTTFPSLNINNCSEAVHVENSDANSTEGLRVENDSPYSIVSTCNGGVASVSCINDVVVGGDTASYTWGNKIIGSSLTDANNGILLMGNADRTVIANNSYRVVTNHYTDNGIDTQIMDEIASVIPGTLAVDGNITAPNLLSANVTNHFTVSQEMDALGTATSGTNYGAGAWLFQTSTWNGSAPDTCASSFGLSPGTGTNPTLYWSLNSCGGQPASLNLANLTSITLPPATLNTNGTANAAQNGLNLVNGTNTTAVNSGGSTVAVTCNNATAGTAGCTVVPTSSPALASSGSQVIAANTSGSGTQVVLSGTPTISDSLTLASTTAGGSVLLTLGSGNTTNITLGVPTVSGNLEATMSATTGSIGGGALIAGQAATGTATLTGATTLMGCTANPAGGVSPGAGFIPKCEILTTGTATVSVVAVIAGTPTATTYNVHVIQ